MGLSLFKVSKSPVSRSIIGGTGAPFFDPAAVEPGNPVPSNFRVVRVLPFPPLLVAEIEWPDARNYEGRKILLYRATVEQLSRAELLDPHFVERKGPTIPIARFEPTESGWSMACRLAEALQ